MLVTVIMRVHAPIILSCVNKHQRIPKWQSKWDNPEKLTTQATQYDENHNTICVEHHNLQTNTNNVNKTRALL